MEILYLGGFKQTVYFDTGRLQGYPLCEIDFFHFLIGFSIRDWSIEMWEGLPQKLVTPKNWLPPKKWLPQKNDQKKIGYHPKKNTPKNWSKKNGYPKNFGVLYCEGVYYWILEKWRTLFCTGLLMRFKHYIKHASHWQLRNFKTKGYNLYMYIYINIHLSHENFINKKHFWVRTAGILPAK